jgi:sugar (pentulose or hexulose) kinase
MRAANFEPKLNVASGGPAKSELWMQMHADVSGVPISLTRVSESPVLGAAMLAAVGAGIYPDIPTAGQHMVHTERTIEPDQARYEEYGFWVERYIEMYPSVKDVMHKTARHVDERAEAAERTSDE